MKNKKQSGFTIIEIIIAIVVLLTVVFLGWWVFIGSKNDQNKNVITGSLVEEDRKKLESQLETVPLVGESSAPTANSDSPAATSQSGSGQTQNQPSTPSIPSVPSTPTPSTSPTPAPPSDSAPSSGYTRPTTAFCQEKNGSSFTNAWVTDNNTHTYQIWENGWVNKTETGTAALNYDTMKVVGVIPFLSQAKWAICSDKSGYISFYYQPSGSVYTYNWLVPFEHITVAQP